MVACGTLIEPLSAATDIGVRAVSRWMIQRALRHQDPLTDGNRVAIRTSAAADASLRVLTYDRVGRISIQCERSVVGLAAHIAHGKHEVSGDPAFDRQTPLLAGGC